MLETKRLKKWYRKFLRRRISKRYKQGIKNRDCSIISLNCVGGGGEP